MGQSMSSEVCPGALEICDEWLEILRELDALLSSQLPSRGQPHQAIDGSCDAALACLKPREVLWRYTEPFCKLSPAELHLLTQESNLGSSKPSGFPDDHIGQQEVELIGGRHLKLLMGVLTLPHRDIGQLNVVQS